MRTADASAPSYGFVIVLCMHAALTRATRGKGIIISSGAREAFELRGAYDVINIGVLFGLSEQQAKVLSVLSPCMQSSGGQ